MSLTWFDIIGKSDHNGPQKPDLFLDLISFTILRFSDSDLSSNQVFNIF